MPSSSSHKTSLSLLGRVQEKDPHAWSQLVELYSPLAASWCYRYHLSPEETADVIQDFFLAVSRSVDRFSYNSGPTAAPKPGSFRAWLWTIARNKIRDCIKLRKPDQGAGGDSNLARLEQSPDRIVSELALPDEEPTTDIDKQSLLGRALQQVKPHFQENTFQAFWRCVVDGQSTGVVAEQLGMTDAGVRQARSRVLRRLRQQMGDLP